MIAVFAIPGDKDRRTGGFIYEATVLRVLNELGYPTQHMILPDSFPDPTAADMATTLNRLRDVPPTCPIILDGLVFGSIDPAGLATVQAPVIAMIHHPLGLETGLNAERAKMLRRNEIAALKHANHVIVPSPHTADILIREFEADPEKITIAAPGFDRPALVPEVAREKMDPPLILSVGLLAPRKGHDVLLDALSQMTKVSWQAEIVGKPHDTETFKALSRQLVSLDLSHRVSLVGELNEAQLDARFRSASVFALATRYEGYGMVLSEAMLYGLPVVSCSVGAVPETVGNAGILSPVNDAQAFAKGLQHALHNQDLFAAKSRVLAQSLPTWADTSRCFVKVVKALTG